MEDLQAEYTQALKEYVAANEAHNKLVDRFFKPTYIEPGQEIPSGEPITEDALSEITASEERREKAF